MRHIVAAAFVLNLMLFQCLGRSAQAAADLEILSSGGKMMFVFGCEIPQQRLFISLRTLGSLPNRDNLNVIFGVEGRVPITIPMHRIGGDLLAYLQRDKSVFMVLQYFVLHSRVKAVVPKAGIFNDGASDEEFFVEPHTKRQVKAIMRACQAPSRTT